MAQSGWRLPDDLLRRVRVRCAEEGVRQNEFVERALESALNGGPRITIDSSLLKAAKEPGPKPLKFTAEEEAQHRKAERAEIARQLVPDADRARPVTKRKPKPAAGGLPSIAPRHWGAK